MNKPNAATLRADTRIDWAGTFNLAVNTPDPLTAEIDLAWAYIEQVTGQDLDALTDANLTALATRAVTYVVIYQAAQGVGSFPQVTNEVGGIQSFSVPGYSETRADLSRGRQSGQQPYRIHPWPYLDNLLWLLATEEMRDYWLRQARGAVTPAFGYAHEDEIIRLWGIDRDQPN